ncbi:MAG: hypothetical protein SFV54_24625 [Bryobacteraceae bacterium]|nr:hypothetical protein [Bryobacteraceae bacterium]
MDGARAAERQRVTASRWRVAAGVAILAALVMAGLWVLPPYIDNFRLQQALEEFVAKPESAKTPEEILRTQVAALAARTGVPVRPSQVRVARNEGRLRIEILYLVRVELPFYSVDLHFHPAAGTR